MNDELQPKNDLPKNPFLTDEEETWAHFFDLCISEFLGSKIFQFNLNLDPAAELADIKFNETPLPMSAQELYLWRINNSVAAYMNQNFHDLPMAEYHFLTHIADAAGMLFAALVERRREARGKGMGMRRGGPQGFQVVLFEKPPGPRGPGLPDFPDFLRKLINRGD